MVPVSSLIMMAVCALMGFAVPLALSWWLVRKYKVRPAVILIGAGVFVVFALVLESAVHQVVLKGPGGQAILGNTWYYALYGGLMAGLFEETGRFLSMKYLLKKEPSDALTGAAYGVGHGGAEMILVFGFTMVSNLVLSVMINTGQAESILSSAPGEAREQIAAQFAQLQELRAGTLLTGVWERLSALILHVGLSLMVWTAVRKGGRWLWLFPAAILLHSLVDACAVVLVKNADMLVVELIVFALAVAIGTAGFMLARNLSRNDTV
ncbi:MAG: YhfC family intramembrane metalloprotease [Bacteroidales bacterium]|nr:YhfC family intramembrane metalloprotease [Bacteroidales bacterium]